MLRLIFVTLFVMQAMFTEAHSGKARFHVVIDTDGAADDLRAMAMLLGNREVEVLAVTSSEGALPPAETAVRVAALLREFHHEGIPVGVGRAAGADAPVWREWSRQTVWGDTTALAPLPSAHDVLSATLAGEDEPVTVVALGALTNIADIVQHRPQLRGRIGRIVWYDDSTAGRQGANFAADSLAAQNVSKSGVALRIISENPDFTLPLDEQLLDVMASTGTPYARKIVAAHRTPPLDRLVAARHLRLWDDLAVLYLFAPEMFDCRVEGTVGRCTLAVTERGQVQESLLAILRGRPDAESRVFYGFPTDTALYAQDAASIVDSAISRHGMSEWRAGVLTNELHGHLGIYATIGVKMGIRAREYFNIGVDDIHVTSFAGSRPPVSCMNDGLQVATGATIGHGLITVADVGTPRPEALFRFKEKTIRLTLKPEYADRIRRDVAEAIARYGNLTEAYWLYIRELALRYWVEFDRHEIFVLTVE